MADMEAEVFRQEWNLPHDNTRAMACYTMTQELATWLHYVNLRKVVNGADPALDRILGLISVDERAHYDFFRRVVSIYLEEDRAETLEQLRRVLNTFAMPAVHLLADSEQRIRAVKELRIFDDDIYFYHILEPILAALGLSKKDLRRRSSPRQIVALGVSG
jgi:acyl-[acyl-carrier-protein] desaturase